VPGNEEAERSLAMADEALARLDVAAAVAHLSAAVRRLTEDRECRAAAMASVRLGDVMVNFMGNATAGKAWFVRARRLVEDEPLCLEQGYVAVAAMGCDVDDPAELLAAAELALDRARRFGDVNLETKALADAGLAHVQAGRVGEGMALLDEAMALACGPADQDLNAAKSVCSFFTACYYTADFERADSWAGLLRQRGLIGPVPVHPLYLSAHCDSVQATLLVELGRWGEAEAVLTRAKADFEAALGPSWHPDIALADLRTRQGRLAEAETLLLGKDHAMQALLPAARLQLARGDIDLARAVVTRGLRAVADDRPRAAELLAILVDVELAAGRTAAAEAAAMELAARAEPLDLPTLHARSAAARARVLAAEGDEAGAVAALGAVVEPFDRRLLPWPRAQLLLELAQLRERADDRATAGLDAKAAAAILASLDVVLSPADAALLERLVGDREEPARPVQLATLSADGRWWVASCDAATSRLADTKGLRYVAELVANAGQERHVLDLVDRIEGVAAAGAVGRRDLGDAGPLLDGRARSEYRRRVEQLRSEIDDAFAADQLDRAEAAQAELDVLVLQLAQAFGLGGRDRRAASAAERARLNVTRALRAATARLDEALPGAGNALDRRLRTGLYCAYEPATDDAIRWIVQS
jgi:hypothetical protein